MIFLGIMGSLSLFLQWATRFSCMEFFIICCPVLKLPRSRPLCLYVHRVNCAAGRLRHAVAARRFNGRRPRKTETACLPHYRRCRVSLRPVGTSGGRGCFKGRYHGFPHEFPAFRRSGIGPAKAYRRAPVSSGAQGNLDMRFIFYCRKRHCSAPVPQETISRQTGIIILGLVMVDLLVFGYGFAAADTDPDRSMPKAGPSKNFRRSKQPNISGPIPAIHIRAPTIWAAPTWFFSRTRGASTGFF